MPTALTGRVPFLACFIICATLLGYGYYLQFVEHLDPCPLCIFQRVAYMAIGAIGLLAAVHGAGRRVYGGLIGLAAIIGFGIAGRQVWLQHLPPDQVPECGPGLEFMLQIYSFNEVLREAFTGSGECANVDWRFLGLSIAEWSLLWFAAFIVLAAVIVLTRARNRGESS
ncbi:MAG: disulfide bond formation protein B [Gammaproteobacteria bacterium]|nr:disulfide bond formation protein B [Gammaproteobacteria bacterium]NNM00321.1 disulfide bond formation protein B [Gammaproteobacteria bacterium]